MKTGTYLLDRLKEKFSISEDTESEGFPDMNYAIGNTTGLDVGAEPGPLPHRIGSAAQKGGSILEVLLKNPATFQVDREELLNSIQQLDVDVTFHGEPNIGFGAAYSTRAPGVQSGYNIVHRYFTRYLEQLASFKQEVDDERTHYDFDIGYVNMHASTEQLPPLEEQIASDKSADPFGHPITQINGKKTPNIYMNKDFLDLLFDFLLTEYLREIQIYSVFSQNNDRFKKKWRQAQEREADRIYRNSEWVNGLLDKIGIIQTASRIDNRVELDYRELAKQLEFSSPLEPLEKDLPEEDSVENLRDLADSIGALSNIATSLVEGEDTLPYSMGPLQQVKLDISGREEEIASLINTALDALWDGDGVDGLSFEAKRRSLINTINEIEQNTIQERAARKTGIEDEARAAFAGKGDYEGTDPSGNALFQELMDSQLGRVLEREMDKESTVFYNIMPAWMQKAKKEQIRFIWKNIVEKNHDVDVTDYSEFEEQLSEDREFRLDVTAAVSAAYMWGHFTQKKTAFDADRRRGKYGDLEEGDEEEYWTEEIGADGDRMTWVQYMNRYGLTVNIETMFGDPGQLIRLWRPKDIAVACRAVNMTAEEQSSEWDADEYRGPFMKFTMDMEHVASYGVDPEREMELLIEQEKNLAEDYKEVDRDKPLADILKTYHLTKPGFEQQGSHRHGTFARGDTILYRYLYRMVKNGFTRDPEDPGIVMFEIGGEYREEIYVIKVAMNMIELGISPDELDPNKVDPSKKEYRDEREALMARFFGMDKPNVDREWAKIEEHAFDPLKGLLEAEEFDYTWSSQAAVQNDNRPNEWKNEEYK